MTGPDVLATRSRMYPDSLDIMGWDVGASGFRPVLSADLPDFIETYFAEDVTAFLSQHDLTIDDIGSWVSQPGGPKVLESINAALGLDDDALELSWRSLNEIGNLSSASVLHILRDARAKPPDSGTPGLLMAMGPGFCAELVLLRWH
jgi:alkylresorcinol/alkylpyrone synthase